MVLKRNRFGAEEELLLKEALDSNDLWPYIYPSNPRRHFIGEATKAIEEYFGSPDEGNPPFMIPTASGTSSIQVALGGLRIPAGREVIVTPITDPGTISPIIFHNAIPVFADVDPTSGLISPETVKSVLTDRTSAVIAVHLTGSPVDVPGIRQMLENEGRSDVKIIEDVAQGLGASLDGTPLGMLGDAGCFSLNSQKHITVGEGGFVLVQTDLDFVRTHNFSDKHRNRFYRKEPKEHSRYEGVGHSLRMSELQGAMLFAQLPKLDGFAKARYELGARLDELLQNNTTLVPQSHLDKSYPTFFFYMFTTPDELGETETESEEKKTQIINEVSGQIDPDLKARFSASYNQWDQPIYRYPVFQTKNFSPNSPFWPAALVAEKDTGGVITSDSYDYNNIELADAESYLRRSFTISGIHESFKPEHADQLFEAIVKGFREADRPVD